MTLVPGRAPAPRLGPRARLAAGAGLAAALAGLAAAALTSERACRGEGGVAGPAGDLRPARPPPLAAPPSGARGERTGDDALRPVGPARSPAAAAGERGAPPPAAIAPSAAPSSTAAHALLDGEVVLEGSGEPVAGARVLLAEVAALDADDFAAAALEAETDSAGRFAFAGLRPGRAHDLAVEAEGALALEVRVPPLGDGEARALRIALAAAALLVVRVEDAGGAPVAGARVSWWPEGGEAIGDERASAGGDSDREVRGFAPAGPDGIARGPVGPRPIEVWVRPGLDRPDLASASLAVDASPGARIDRVVRLGPGGGCRLRIVDGDGRPLVGVAATPDSEPVAARAVSDAAGRVAFAHLPPPGVEIALAPPGGERTSVEVAIRAGEMTEETVVLDARALAGGGGVVAATLDASGEALDPSTSARGADAAPSPRAAPAPPAPAASGMDPEVGRPPLLLRLEPPPGGLLPAHAGALVAARPPGGGARLAGALYRTLRPSATTSGLFTLEPAPAAPAVVIVLAPGFAPAVLGDLPATSSLDASAPEAEPTALGVPLAPGAALEGRVVDGAGAPVAGAWVLAVPHLDGGGEAFIDLLAHEGRGARTSASGAFQLADLAADTLIVARSGTAEARRVVRLGAPGSAPLRITLPLGPPGGGEAR